MVPAVRGAMVDRAVRLGASGLGMKESVPLVRRRESPRGLGTKDRVASGDSGRRTESPWDEGERGLGTKDRVASGRRRESPQYEGRRRESPQDEGQSCLGDSGQRTESPRDEGQSLLGDSG